jgi:5'-3' exoribonuclease 2
MPHFPSINIRTGGVDKMIQAYKATIGNTPDQLTNGKKIYWKNVRKLVQFLSNMEEEYLLEEMKLRNKRERKPNGSKDPKEVYESFNSIPIIDREIEKYINPYTSHWENRYYKSLFSMDINDTRKKQICVNYLEGLEWTMKYYTTGCPDWRWCYHYNYPPLLKHLIHYIPYFDTEFISTQSPNPVNELVQLSYVLPKQTLHLLPAKLYKELTENHGEWYKSDCQFVWAFCRYFWESHVDLPEININELERIVEKNM